MSFASALGPMRILGPAGALGPALAALFAAAPAGCGSGHSAPADAPGDPDALAPDAPDLNACPRGVFVATANVTAESQGWSVIQQAPATLTYDGVGVARLDTSTPTGGTTSGQLVLRRTGVLPPPPFRVEIELFIDRVNPHNQLDAGVAILGAFTPPFGTAAERAQMIYLDADRIGWADDSQSAAALLAADGYHTVELAVAAGGAAQVSLDGAPVLTRAGFTADGSIAVGDQTNDAAVDGAILLRRVTVLCP